MLRRMAMSRGLQVFAAAMILSACGEGQPASTAADVGRVSFQPGVDVGMAAPAHGVLGGDADTGCLWFEDGSKTVGLVVQDDTAVADFDADPPVIRDGETVVATFGQEVWLVGGYVKSFRAATGCAGVGSTFLAGRPTTTPRD